MKRGNAKEEFRIRKGGTIDKKRKNEGLTDEKQRTKKRGEDIR
jgi:hypothetical protein